MIFSSKEIHAKKEGFLNKQIIGPIQHIYLNNYCFMHYVMYKVHMYVHNELIIHFILLTNDRKYIYQKYCCEV